jgi:putative lipoprotein
MSDLLSSRLWTLCLASAISPAVWAASPAAPAGNAPLRDTQWTLQTLDGVPVTGAEAQPAQLVLHAASQRLSGFAGCNTLRGRYTQRGTQLALTALATTRMACPQLPQEQRFIELLGAATAYRVEGHVLSLLQGETVRITFTATPAKKRTASPKK